MGGATIWPVPRAIDAEAHYYPRHWKRNMFFLYGAAFLIGIQFQRYGLMCRVSGYQQVAFDNLATVSVAKIDVSRRIHGLGQPPCSEEG